MEGIPLRTKIERRVRQGSPAAYAVAVVSSVVTMVVYLSAINPAEGRPLLMAFLFPIMVSAYLGGWRPGLLATLLCAALSDYCLLAPLHSVLISRSIDLVRWFVLIACGTTFSVLCESLHRARHRAVERQREHAVTLASISDAVITTDESGRIRFLNREAERLTGWKFTEALGQPLATVFRIVSEQTRQPAADPVENVLRTGKTAGLANRTLLVARDGRETIIDDSAAPIRHEDGKITGVVLVFRDNTERKRAEDLLRTQAALLHETGELAKLGGWDFDPLTGEGNMTDEVYRIHDLEPGTPMSKDKGLEFYPGESRKTIEAAVAAAVANGTPYDLELEFVSARGVHKWVRTNCHPVVENGRVTRVRGTMQDITDRKSELEQAAHERARFKLIFDTIPIGIAFNTTHPDGTVERDINDAHLRICGFTRAMHDEPGAYQKITHYNDRAKQQELQQQVLAGRIREFSLEKRYLRNDGTLVWVHFTFKRETYPDGTVEDLTTVTDITARKLEVEQTARERARFKLIFDTIPIGIAFNTTHPDGTVERDINDAHLRICGFTRAMHDEPDAYLKITFPDDRARQSELHQQLLTGCIKQFSMEKRYLRNDGSLVWVVFALKREIYPDGTIEDLTTVTDITERKRMEEQLRQSSKMEAIGLLAGGVAHDFNNILAIIQIQLGLLAGDGELSKSQTNLINELSKAAERAANLTRQLLLFSRKQSLLPRDLDLNDTVASVAKMLQRTIGEDIHLQLAFAAEPLLVHADPGMMDQILVNLAVNARDAMPQGGSVAIELGAVNFDDKNPPADSQGRAGAFVCIQVGDTGVGIPPENLPRIFDPFFTTKDVSKGTGLGLATVYGIVQQHQGWITVESEVGRGTKFRIFLPRLAKGWQTITPASAAGSARGGHETILVVEDEPELRRLVKRILNHLGYRVLDAGHGRDALEIWRRERDKIQLVLTDLILPDGLNGKDIAREMLAEKPGLKVVYASGYSADIAGPDLALQEGVNFLAKPYLAHNLAEIVRHRLDMD